MSDIILFLRVGWNNAWKNKTVFLFAALVQAGALLTRGLPADWHSGAFPAYPLVRMAALLLAVLLSYMGLAGITYAAYCSALNLPAPLAVVWAAARHALWRVVGLSCLALVTIVRLSCSWSALWPL